MEYFNTYLELMMDIEFSVYVVSALIGLIFFVVILSALAKATSATVPVELAPDLPGEPAVSRAPYEGVMEWGGDDVKTKKTKAALPAVSPAPAVSAPGPSTKKGANTETLILPPAEAGAVRALGEKGGTTVDLLMYEALVRRISGLEGEVKKEPLFLDPLMKRINQLEKRVEENTQKKAEASPAPSVSGPDGAASEAEKAAFKEDFLALKEKVYGLQKILEHLAESPTPPPAP
jgi:hypothetical protein